MVQHILKLGGSLLDINDLDLRIKAIVDQLQLRHCLLVIGGGTAADQIRNRQQADQFDDEVAHWDAIEAMSVNATQMFENRHGFRIVADRADLGKTFLEANCIAVLDATRFIRAEENNLPEARNQLTVDTRLRPSWDVTSDSIAAWLGLRLGASAVWLLKSCDPTSLSVSDLSRTGELDTAITELRFPSNYLHWINLRSPHPSQGQSAAPQSLLP